MNRRSLIKLLGLLPFVRIPRGAHADEMVEIVAEGSYDLKGYGPPGYKSVRVFMGDKEIPARIEGDRVVFGHG